MRHPVDAVNSLFNAIGTPLDKVRVGAARLRALRGSMSDKAHAHAMPLHIHCICICIFLLCVSAQPPQPSARNSLRSIELRSTTTSSVLQLEEPETTTMERLKNSGFGEDFVDEFYPHKLLLFNNKSQYIRWFSYMSILLVILGIGVFGEGQFIYFKF